MREKKRYGPWLWLGILGAILMCSGDWLLGYVDPAIVGACRALRVGYTEEYALWRPVVAMETGSAGAICYFGSLWGMKLTMHAGKMQKGFWVTALISLFGWLLIHYFFCQLVYQYAWGVQNGISGTLESSEAVYEAFSPVIMLWYGLMAVPFVIHFIATLRNETLLPRWTAALHPVTWMALLAIITELLPQTPFVYGLHMGAMSESMLIWFITALVLERRNR